ncbi:MAG: transposase [Thermodesulfobacteriota bacterium]
MPRKPRLNLTGYYHIINRGVERRKIFLDEEDHLKFLDIIEDTKKIHRFKLHAYCLMDNHYHLLIETSENNLSLIMKQINSRYSIYFNRKHNRVGPLWQGRYKSWFVHEDSYLESVVKYIEGNPVRAEITEKIGEFRWASKLSLEYELSQDLTDKDIKNIEELYSADFQNNKSPKKEPTSLEYLFKGVLEKNERNKVIYKAVCEGHSHLDIAKYLGVSNILVSKVVKIENEKRSLFEKLRDKGIFWSYSKNISYDEMDEDIFIEYLLKYGDFSDIKSAFKLFGKRRIKKVWENSLKNDTRFIKLNLLIARVFFSMDVESDFFKGAENARLKKLKMLAS